MPPKQKSHIVVHIHKKGTHEIINTTDCDELNKKYQNLVTEFHKLTLKCNNFTEREQLLAVRGDQLTEYASALEQYKNSIDLTNDTIFLKIILVKQLYKHIPNLWNWI